jgi:hypothetical protein
MTKEKRSNLFNKCDQWLAWFIHYWIQKIKDTVQNFILTLNYNVYIQNELKIYELRQLFYVCDSENDFDKNEAYSNLTITTAKMSAVIYDHNKKRRLIFPFCLSPLSSSNIFINQIYTAHYYGLRIKSFYLCH